MGASFVVLVHGLLSGNSSSSKQHGPMCATVPEMFLREILEGGNYRRSYGQTGRGAVR